MSHKEYIIIRSARKTLAIQVKDGKVLVRSPEKTNKAEIDAFLKSHERWIERQLQKQEEQRKESSDQPKLSQKELDDLKEEARRVIPERVRFYAKQIKVTYGKITIRCQKTRWGSCSSKGNLNFNCLLMLMPPEVLDSVVVHELCHRIEMNHSARFYEEVHKAYPDYDQWDKWLKKNGNRYLSRLP